MQAGMRPYAFAGAVVLGASVIAVNQLAPHPNLEHGLKHISNAAVRLASGDALPDLNLQDLANIPYNLFASIVNLPYYEFADPISTATAAGGEIAFTTADPGVGVVPMPETSLGDIGLLDNVLAYEGNFWLLDSVNVLGIDPGDPGKVAAFADILTGNPDIGNAFSAQLIPILEAELPLQAGCVAASAGGCPDPLEILTGSTQPNGVEVPGYFSVPLQDFFSSTGYTFPGTTDPLTNPLTNPVPSGEPIPPGFPPDTPTNPIPTDPTTIVNEPLPWSGTTVSLDQNGPLDAYLAYLTQSPADNPIEFPTLQDVTTDLSNLTTGLFNSFNPFVPGTYCAPCAPFVSGDTTSPFTSLLDGSNLSTDLTSLLDGSTFTTDLTALFDPSTFTTDLTALFDPSTFTTDLTALLGTSAATDIGSLLAADLAPTLLTSF
jgi:hypothetical protein